MPRRRPRLGAALFSGGIIAAAPLMAACAVEPTYDEWAATDGAAGRINLDDVQEAFKRSESATEFETLVNQIYEGDGIIFIRARQDGDALTLEGWEDLNGNNEIDDAQDDLLFSIVKEQDQNTLQGHGSNGYYRRGFGGGDFLFTYLLLSSFSRGPYFYHSPSTRGGTLRNQRTSYRNSSRYTGQVSKNSKYFTNQKKFAGSSYRDAAGNQSSARRTYKTTQRSSGTFKNSRTTFRSSGGTARGAGGFRGGSGALMVLKGRKRQLG